MFASPASVLDILHSTTDPNQLWERLFPFAQRYTKQALGWQFSRNHEDCVYEAVYRALDSINRYKHTFRGGSEGQARAWVRAIVVRAAKKEAGRAAANAARFLATEPENLVMIFDHRASYAEEFFSREEAMAVLESAVRNEEWRDLWLRHNDPDGRLSVEELSALTGRTVGTVTVTLSRVRSAIRSALDQAA